LILLSTNKNYKELEDSVEDKGHKEDKDGKDEETMPPKKTATNNAKNTAKGACRQQA